MNGSAKEGLIKEIQKLHIRHELARTIPADYFEPGMMEFLEQSDGNFDEESGKMIIFFESKGTVYSGRTEQIEKVKLGDKLIVKRDSSNLHNHNNFLLLTEKGHDVGCMPVDLCNVIAPLYDDGKLIFENIEVSYVEPISRRSRHAKKAILFVKLEALLV